jgi:hypothetical protein
MNARKSLASGIPTPQQTEDKLLKTSLMLEIGSSHTLQTTFSLEPSFFMVEKASGFQKIHQIIGGTPSTEAHE